ncbi:hypothetical protein [Methanolobus psychrotolerans]|uniref:hypothetical protein n=1 Tax=Methanolobus psychrotolerans TaxID=1874706 RepID=UPI0013EC897F|nr:hypothetical protein [Methanolobus psychrotolerans]
MTDAKLLLNKETKDEIILRIGNLLLFIVLFSMLSVPASAAYEWDNNINVKTDSMIWGYTEKYSGERSLIFKTFIDMEFGDHDGFVSAWELLKADVNTRKSFFKSIKDNMDVKIDESSKNVTLLRVDSDMSRELIGPVDEQNDIVNSYLVFYDFKTPLTGSGSTMWFQGEPGTSVTINLPHEMDVISIEGIDNESINESSKGTRIYGKFGFTGEAVLKFSIEEPPVQQKENNITEAVPVNNSMAGSPSMLDRIFPGLTDHLLEKLNAGKSNVS